MSEASPSGQLAADFLDGEWRTDRVWLRRRDDKNPFVTANILLILERCRGAGALEREIGAAREHLLAYRAGHQAFHWPVSGGRSRMADAPPLWRHRHVEISPDADCTCLVQLARRDGGLDEGILNDLSFYRAEGRRFRLPGFQRALPRAAGSYLSWFPPRERCRDGKLETVDVGVDANILWYLAAIGRLDAPGAAETVAFVAACVGGGLLMRDPFRVSLYYPSAAVLHYLIARAAVWGDIAGLRPLREAALQQLARCPAPTALDVLCRETARRLWGVAPERPLPEPDGRGAFYVGPLLAWPLQRCAPLLPLARSRRTHIEFRSRALEGALRLWLCES